MDAHHLPVVRNEKGSRRRQATRIMCIIFKYICVLGLPSAHRHKKGENKQVSCV
jgi:hypothetical protein